MAASEMAGNLWDTMGLPVAEMVKQRGNTITVLAEDEKAKWQKATEPVIEAWVKGSKEKNIDGAKLLETVKGLLAKHEKA